MELTARSASVFAEWISDRRSGHSGGVRSLRTLKCNGNNLGINGVWKIIHAIRTSNWSLVNVELYANHIPGPGIPNHNSPFQQTAHLPETEESWRDAERALRSVLQRNSHLKRQTEKEALNLLKYSRILIFRSRASLLPADKQTSSHSASKSFPFHSLPMELQLQILAVLAPSLSGAQRSRIYEYAADSLTLPPLLPFLRRDISNVCVVDPSQPLGVNVGFALRTSGGCAVGECLGTSNSLVCRREAERATFVAAVGCCTYEPES